MDLGSPASREGHSPGGAEAPVVGTLGSKNWGVQVRVGKGDKPVTYEETHALHFIVHRKGWLWLQQKKREEARVKVEFSAQCTWILALEFPLTLRGALFLSGNLGGEDHAAEPTAEDVFLWKFMLGTFPGCLLTNRS
ncbi:small ribosomal subunit protein uS3m-like isoform X2 [Canis lupus baileyi]|uniref:small ribosomal subunit protein uS3m-like isoform X2 n=1 Tax=Canis lupus baileyi TaxID=143281 RepID=UPI0018F3DEB8